MTSETAAAAGSTPTALGAELKFDALPRYGAGPQI